MKQETISIIVPVYNIEDYLPRCLDSILAQTYPYLEVIAVDDGSRDGSGGILDAYAGKDSRVKVIHQENGGVTRARFAGLRAATGDWIGFVDGDDFVEPQMFGRLLENALEHGAQISHCGYQMVFPNRVDYYYNSGRILRQEGRKGLLDLLEGSLVEPGLWNKLYRRELFPALLDSGMDALGIRINEDLLMNFYLFRQAEMAVYEDICPYHYIIRPGSAANDKKKHHLTDPIRVTERIFRELRGEETLEPAILRLHARRLIPAAIQKDYPDVAAEARTSLRILCREEGRKLPRKERLMACLAAYARPLYRTVRRAYELVTKVDHKYDLE